MNGGRVDETMSGVHPHTQTQTRTQRETCLVNDVGEEEWWMVVGGVVWDNWGRWANRG